MGKEESKEMLFWTTDEYKRFSEAIIDKPMSYYAFEMLYWTGMRLGGKDVITTPKTKKSNRTIKMPNF